MMIETKNLTKKYGKFVAVNNLNLTIPKGEIFALIGPNGAGKTTIMRMLVGLIEPTSGTAKVGNYDIIKDTIKVKKISGYLPENVSLYEDLTARENVKYIADLNGCFEKKKIEDMLEMVGLGKVKDKKAGEFSKGMTQKLGLASVLIKNPTVLFLDEPTSGLDPNSKIEIQNLLKKLKDEGLTIFFSSHVLAEVKGISDRVGIIHNGNLEQIVEKKVIDKLEEIYIKITGLT